MRSRRGLRKALLAVLVLLGLAMVLLIVLNPDRALEKCIHVAHMEEGESVEGRGWQLHSPGFHCTVTRQDGSSDEVVVSPW